MAGLARLRIDESHIPRMADQLNSILAHMEALRQATGESASEPPDGATPMSSSAWWRPDVLRHDDGAMTRDAFAPEMRDGFFLVPRLATHDGQRVGDEGVPRP